MKERDEWIKVGMYEVCDIGDNEWMSEWMNEGFVNDVNMDWI